MQAPDKHLANKGQSLSVRQPVEGIRYFWATKRNKVNESKLIIKSFRRKKKRPTNHKMNCVEQSLLDTNRGQFAESKLSSLSIDYSDCTIRLLFDPQLPDSNEYYKIINFI